jgi:hypothetical protein
MRSALLMVATSAPGERQSRSLYGPELCRRVGAAIAVGPGDRTRKEAGQHMDVGAFALPPIVFESSPADAEILAPRKSPCAAAHRFVLVSAAHSPRRSPLN